MQILVDLHLVVFGLLCGLAIICALVHFALRSGSALAWLAATMACVGAETLVFRYAAQTRPGVAAISMLVPLAYLCAANAIRQSLHLELASGRQVRVLAGLVGLSLILLAADVAAFYQCIPFQLAGVWIFYDAIRIQARQRFRSSVDNALLVLCCCSMVGLAVRAPMFPLLLGQPTPFPIMDVKLFEGIFINALSALTSGLAVLVIARIVGNVIAMHRFRAEHDDLTGLLNRQIFDEVARQAEGSSGSVIMCDIDHFKAVNDLYGHHVGDDVIRSFACILTHFADFAGRMGGEEFAILMNETPLEEAVVVADAIRSEFHQYRHDTIGEETALSASFGVAAYDRKHTIKSAFQLADKALYQAKANGRNRVCRGTVEVSGTTLLEKAA